MLSLQDTAHQVMQLVLSADHVLTDVINRQYLSAALTQEEGLQRQPSTLPHRAQTWKHDMCCQGHEMIGVE